MGRDPDPPVRRRIEALGAAILPGLGVVAVRGLRESYAGRIEVLGLDPGERSSARQLREQIGLVLQDIAVEPYLTVRETVVRNAGYYVAPRDVDEVIGLVGLAGRERQLVKNLSGGQKRRLDLALGVIGDPRLLFLDEPTTGFDPSARRGAWQNIRDLRDAGATILLTTHDMDEAQALADRVAVIAAGRIVAEGTPATLGGRDAAGACIRFDLPAALHRLTRWALDRGSTLPGLAVDGRPSRRSTSG